MKTLRLLFRIFSQFFREGLLPSHPLHWVKIARALWRSGPGYFFLLEVAAARFPHREAIRDEYGTLSFEQLREEARSLAVLLRERYQIGPGDKVGLILSNHRGFILSLAAVTRLGADVLPLHPRLGGPQWQSLLQGRRVDLVIHEDGVSQELDFLPRKMRWSPGTIFVGELSRTSRTGQLVVLTSGTTGVSKGIRRDPKISDVLPATWGLWQGLPLALHRPMVLAIPLFHGYGLATLALSLFLGAPLRLARRFEIESLLSHNEGEAPVLVTVPTLLWRWLESRPELPDLAGIITGSAPLTPSLCARILERVGPKLYNLYGSTEAGVVSLATPDELQWSPGCVGRPLPGNEVRLWPPYAEIGEIEVRGPLVLQPGEGGWRKTGDLGRFDEKGSLVVCGRSDSMIVSGGKNVYPHELGEVLETSPQLTDSAVLVVEDEEFGQRLAAAVVPTPSAAFSIEELKAWLKGRLERHKLPRDIFVVENIPRNALGKVDRMKLKSLIEETS